MLYFIQEKLLYSYLTLNSDWREVLHTLLDGKKKMFSFSD